MYPALWPPAPCHHSVPGVHTRRTPGLSLSRELGGLTGPIKQPGFRAATEHARPSIPHGCTAAAPCLAPGVDDRQSRRAPISRGPSLFVPQRPPCGWVCLALLMGPPRPFAIKHFQTRHKLEATQPARGTKLRPWPAAQLWVPEPAIRSRPPPFCHCPACARLPATRALLIQGWHAELSRTLNTALRPLFGPLPCPLLVHNRSPFGSAAGGFASGRCFGRWDYVYGDRGPPCWPLPFRALTQPTFPRQFQVLRTSSSGVSCRWSCVRTCLQEQGAL